MTVVQDTYGWPVAFIFKRSTHWESNVAINNSSIIDDFPIKTSIYRECAIATFIFFQRVEYKSF